MTRRNVTVALKGSGPTGRAADPEQVAFLERWRQVLLETWEPHRNPHDGGALLMRLKSKTDCSITWCKHSQLVDMMNQAGCLHPPCDRPAHEVDRPLSGVPGDICWLLVFDGDTTHVHAIEWPHPTVAGGDS